METTAGIPSLDEARRLLKQHWGYDDFRPSQAAAMEAVLSGRDALVILPTGGGKSLTYQLPAVVLGGLAVVVSPLIALMKDQVDALHANGIAAAALDSTRTPEEKRRILDDLRANRIRLLYVSPERLANADMQRLLLELEPRFFAIDEAHCLSQWGHDFRPEYRQLDTLRAQFPGVPILACTATATEQVRDDIARVLRLQNPVRVVGDFDRPNLLYRAQPRTDLDAQIEEVLARHKNEAGIVYALRRKDVDEIAERLARRGHRVRPYHAGLDKAVREENQRLFSNEEVDVVVATVAFGMGIDRSNVRYVVHAGIPKSLEAYQQEAGRAGRDGLVAECIVFYSLQDVVTWRGIMGAPVTEVDYAAREKVEEMYRYCRTLACRHAALVRYFGQPFTKASCEACDVCRNEHALIDDATTLARKILSCVVRVKEGFGARYVAEVLHGSKQQKILDREHDRLSTWGLLKNESTDFIVDCTEQLVGLGLLARDPEYQSLKLTPEGRTVLRGEGEVRLARPKALTEKAVLREALNDGEQTLFEQLRVLRKTIAQEQGVPPFVVFGDATLHELCRVRPSDTAGLLRVRGIGQTKAASYGPRILSVLAEAAGTLGLSLDAVGTIAPAPVAGAERRKSEEKKRALELFGQGWPVEEVAREVGRAVSTCEGYLAEFLEGTNAQHGRPWVSDDELARILDVATRANATRLGEIHQALGGQVPYVQIKAALVVRSNQLGR